MKNIYWWEGKGSWQERGQGTRKEVAENRVQRRTERIERKRPAGTGQYRGKERRGWGAGENSWVAEQFLQCQVALYLAGRDASYC